MFVKKTFKVKIWFSSYFYVFFYQNVQEWFGDEILPQLQPITTKLWPLSLQVPGDEEDGPDCDCVR